MTKNTKIRKIDETSMVVSCPREDAGVNSKEACIFASIEQIIEELERHEFNGIIYRVDRIDMEAMERRMT